MSIVSLFTFPHPPFFFKKKQTVIHDSISIDALYRCRAGGSELPNIAALMGGLVSQEAIKLITRQYIPMNNTTIFDGVRSTTSTYVL